jgi:hypothetical protein
MSFRTSKKADLSLSTNAIVVMIIAITILGLALSFTRGIFQKLGGQIENIGGKTIVEEPPTYEKPLTLTSNQIEVRKGKTYSLTIAVFNKFSESEGCVEGTEDVCKMRIDVALGACMNAQGIDFGDVANGGSGMMTLIKPAPKSIMINEYDSFSTKLKVGAGTPVGDYACTIKALNADDMTILSSKDIMVSVI